MSFLGDLDITAKLAEKATDLVEKKGGDYFDDLIEEGDKQIVELVPEEYRDEAKEALDIVEGLKTPLLRLTNGGLAQLLGHWQKRDEANARRYYLEHEATYLERRAAMHATGDRLVDKEDARKAAWDAVEAGLKKLGTLGLKFVGKLALASLGIPV